MPRTSTLVPADLDGRFMKLIETKTGAGANFDFTSIPQTFQSLRLVGQGRSDAAALTATIYIRCNNDSSSVYDIQGLIGANSSTSAFATSATTQGFVGVANGTTASTGTAGTFTVDIPNYRGTTFHKQLIANSLNVNTYGTTSTYQTVQWGNNWRNTAAISRLTLFLASGSWIAGSTVSLYGLP